MDENQGFPPEMIEVAERVAREVKAKFDQAFAEFSAEEQEQTRVRLSTATQDAYREAREAGQSFPPMNSAHEGFAVLLEEVDELWEHVKTKTSKRDIAAMRKEAIQVAAMALRFVADICTDDRGRV